jgi:hypothetical protein
MARSWIPFLLLFAPALALQAQDRPLQHSGNGWLLSPHGTIRILLIFAEIEYDQNPGRDPQPGGATHWPKGQLPVWKDEVFEPFQKPVPQAVVSRYYQDISMGQFVVLGDYIDQLVTIRESEHRGINNAHGMSGLAVTEANKLGALRTRHGLGVEDFDLWKRGGKPGMPKEPGPDSPHSYDHVMVILRNSSLTHGQGSVDGGTPGQLFGYHSDSQSRFGGMNALPFEILKHEFNHLLLGGNNFHSGGGNAAQFQSYFINLQGGWSMMGAGGSSLLTCSAWDRLRMNWLPSGAAYDINAQDGSRRQVNGDLDPLAGDTGIFVLRDFVTTGDALRIRMPFIPDGLHRQWLWIENHLGTPRNGSPTDRFHWEDAGSSCVAPIEPGLFMMMQVEREEREGANIYGDHADYLRPIPANGMYDIQLRGDTLFNTCPFGGNSIPYLLDESRMNPLTGNHEQELPVYDRNGDGILHGGEHWVPGSRVRRGRVEGEMVFFGRPEHAFRMNGVRRIAMGTNPSTANMMTLVSGGTNDLHKRGAPNVRVVYLNGLSVELLAMAPDGAMTVRVTTGETRLNEDMRWCADSLVLPPLRGRDGHSLTLTSRKRLLLDRSATPTRIDQPDSTGRAVWFSDPTRFTVTAGASVLLEEGALLDLRRGTEMHLLPGSSMELQRRARIRVAADCRLVLHGDARISGEERMLERLRKRGRLVQVPQ